METYIYMEAYIYIHVYTIYIYTCIHIKYVCMYIYIIFDMSQVDKCPIAFMYTYSICAYPS